MGENIPGVIVIGGHVQGLGIARIYGKNKIPVIVMDSAKINLARHSKYCKNFIYYEKGTLLSKLMALGEDNKYINWMILPTNDLHVEILSRNKNKISIYFKVSTVDFGILKYFFNKRLTYKLVSDINVDFPITWIANSWNELRKLDICYPCIIKPAVMHTFYSKTKKKVFVCNNRSELKRHYEKALTLIPNDEIIIQDIIPGNSEHQYSVCFMFDGNKPLVTLSARRARQHPLDFGNATTYAETVDIPALVNYAIKILNKVKYTGVCEVEFKYDIRDGKYKFLEVNPRTWKWHALAEKTDSPILMSLYHNIYKLKPIVKNNQQNASFRHLLTDIPTLIKMKLMKMSYPKTNNDTKYAVWELNDLKPALFEIIYLPYFILKR